MLKEYIVQLLTAFEVRIETCPDRDCDTFAANDNWSSERADGLAATLVGAELRRDLENVIENLIELLDDVDGDPERESNGDDLDDEPSV